jgi:hypothetical protein
MRYLFGFVCVLSLLLAWPLSVGAQGGEEGVPKVALAIDTQHRLPPQLMLRLSYYLYLDADADTDATSDQIEPSAEEPSQSVEPKKSLLERWQPEAFVDPTKPKPGSEPALQLGVDSAGLEVTPTAPEQTQEKERSRGAKAGIAVGAILGLGLVVGIAAGISGARSILSE